MSSNEALETPREKRSLSSVLRAYARKVVIPAMLLGVTVSGLGLSATAHAADAPGCSAPTQTCPAEAPWRGSQPGNVSDQDWRAAVTAADFWNTHDINRANGLNELVTSENPQYHQGWPGDTNGRGWYSFTTGSWPRRTTHWIYYGGVFQDRGGQVANQEAGFHVPNMYTDGSTGAYREYDTLSHESTGSNIRGTMRIVRNIYTGHVYATFDHYNTFHYLGRW
ncbi:hypothetical protein ACVNF4_06915 [Streptomyces sp. S6]